GHSQFRSHAAHGSRRRMASQREPCRGAGKSELLPLDVVTVMIIARMRTLFVLSGIAAAAVLHVAGAHPGDSSQHLSPGRVQFTMKSDGEWTGFGARGERPLLEHGGIVIYAGRPGSTLLDERASSAHGGMRG